MKHNLTRSGFLALALSFSLLAAPQAEAAVVITNLVMTTTSISFDISGTMPTTVPGSSPNVIFFTNPSLSASPGFALNTSFTSTNSASFSGTQPLRSVGGGPAGLGFSSFGDYGVFGLQEALTASESLMGTFTATWPTPRLNPAAVTSLDFYWGASNGSSHVNTGTFLGSAAVGGSVPEPSGTALLLCGLATVAARRRRLQ
jgi:hypothetical protein